MFNRMGIVNSLLQHDKLPQHDFVNTEENVEVAFCISQFCGLISRWTCWSALLRTLQG